MTGDPHPCDTRLRAYARPAGRLRSSSAQVFDEIERELGFGIVPNVFRALAENPAVLEMTWQQFRSTVLIGRLPRMLKEMVGVVVSRVHDSSYARLVHLHSLGVQGGLPRR